MKLLNCVVIKKTDHAIYAKNVTLSFVPVTSMQLGKHLRGDGLLQRLLIECNVKKHQTQQELNLKHELVAVGSKI